MQIKKLLPLLLLLIIPIVSAYNGYSDISIDSLIDSLKSEWVMFAIIFLSAFALIYFSLQKTFDQHKGVATILAAGLSLFISIALTKKAVLYDYAGDGLANWIIIIAFVIIALFLLRMIAFRRRADGTRGVSWFWLTIGIIITIILLVFTDVSNLLPESLLYGPVGDFLEMIRGILWIIIPLLISLAIIRLFWNRRGRGSGTPQQQGYTPQTRRQRQQLAQQIRRSRNRAYNQGRQERNHQQPQAPQQSQPQAQQPQTRATARAQRQQTTDFEKKRKKIMKKRLAKEKATQDALKRSISDETREMYERRAKRLEKTKEKLTKMKKN